VLSGPAAQNVAEVLDRAFLRDAHRIIREANDQNDAKGKDVLAAQWLLLAASVVSLLALIAAGLT
jgi:hypothetical protein